ncbi:hypothetical protein [Mycobacterium sp. 48b]
MVIAIDVQIEVFCDDVGQQLLVSGLEVVVGVVLVVSSSSMVSWCI